MPASAADILQKYDNPSLQQMIRFHSIPLKEKAKGRMVAALAPVVFDSRIIAQTLTELSQPARALLDRLILAGGSAPTGLIRRQLEREGMVEPRGKPDRHYYGYSRTERGSARNHGSRKFEDVVAWLGMAGLVFTEQSAGSGRSLVEIFIPGRRLYIPEQILQHLPPVETPIETLSSVSVSAAFDPSDLLRDFYLLLSFAAREPVQLTNRGAINKRTLIRINQDLKRKEDVASVRGEEELGWLSLLRALGEELGLLAPVAGGLVLEPRAADFLQLPADERRTRLFAAYCRTSRWCEVYRIPGTKVRGSRASFRSAPPFVVAARQKVLMEIAAVPVDEWIALVHLVDRIRLLSYEFLFSRRVGENSYVYSDYSYYYDSSALPNPYRGTNQAGWTFDSVSSEEEGWDHVEAGFIRVIAAEVLPSIGVVDLGFENGTVSAFRLTSDGAKLLRGEPISSIAASSNVVVQPNFQIFAFEPTGEGDLFTLDQIADRIRVEQAIEYELTQEAFHRAQRAGYDAARIIDFLVGVSTVELPQNVRRTLEEWGSQAERITVRKSAPLLQAIDEAQLDALYADAEIAPLLGRRIAPAVAFVPASNLIELSNRLVASDRLPTLTEGPDDVPGPRLAAGIEGQLVFHHRLPSVYDVKLVRPFTDEDHGAFRMTAESLRRGAKAGIPADAILATLERLQSEPLLPEVAALVRRWARDWGSGALFQSLILQVDKPEALTDLLADPETREFLKPLPGAPTVALVDPDGVKTLRSLLESRGMSLDGEPSSSRQAG